MVVVVRNRHRENVLLRVSRRRSLRLPSLAQEELGRAPHEPYTLRKHYLNFFTFSTRKKKKSKVYDLYANESQGEP